MEFVQKHNETNVLARWIYSHEEWRHFLRWKLLRKSFIHYFIHLLKPNQKRTPEVIITYERVWIDECHEPFHTGDRQLKRINIRDAGKINVMEITYEQQHPKGTFNNDIRIPVPKGKLREAIDVEEKLNMIKNSNQRG